MATLLSAAQRILIFGFAFNPYDTALLEHLAANGRTIGEVRIIDVNPNLAAARRIWPHAKVTGEVPRTVVER